MTYILSAQAEADLDEIWDYSFEHWGREQANQYTRKIHEALCLLGRSPRAGVACDDIAMGYRKFSIAMHSIYYRIDSPRPMIMRILHQRRDVGGMLH